MSTPSPGIEKVEEPEEPSNTDNVAGLNVIPVIVVVRQGFETTIEKDTFSGENEVVAPYP